MTNREKVTKKTRQLESIVAKLADGESITEGESQRLVADFQHQVSRPRHETEARVRCGDIFNKYLAGASLTEEETQLLNTWTEEKPRRPSSVSRESNYDWILDEKVRNLRIESRQRCEENNKRARAAVAKKARGEPLCVEEARLMAAYIATVIREQGAPQLYHDDGGPVESELLLDSECQRQWADLYAQEIQKHTNC